MEEEQFAEAAADAAMTETEETMLAAKEYAQAHLLDQETMTAAEMLEIAFVHGALYGIDRAAKTATILGLRFGLFGVKPDSNGVH